MNLLEDPHSFLNIFEENYLCGRKKGRKNFPTQTDLIKNIIKKNPSHYTAKKKDHGTERIEAPGKLIPYYPGFRKWLPLKAKRNSSAGINGTWNHGAGTYGTGSNGTRANITGIYGTENNKKKQGVMAKVLIRKSVTQGKMAQVGMSEERKRATNRTKYYFFKTKICS